MQLHLDGVNQYETIFEDGPAARDEILLQYDPPTQHGTFKYRGQAAYRLNEWKLILGQVRLIFASLLSIHRALPAELHNWKRLERSICS